MNTGVADVNPYLKETEITVKLKAEMRAGKEISHQVQVGGAVKIELVGGDGVEVEVEVRVKISQGLRREVPV